MCDHVLREEHDRTCIGLQGEEHRTIVHAWRNMADIFHLWPVQLADLLQVHSPLQRRLSRHGELLENWLGDSSMGKELEKTLKYIEIGSIVQ